MTDLEKLVEEIRNEGYSTINAEARVSMDDVRRRIRQTFSNRLYRTNIARAGRANWLQIKPAIAFARIEEYLDTFE